MSKFIILVEALTGYFKEIIWAKLKVLLTGGHIDCICTSLDLWEWDKVQHLAVWFVHMGKCYNYLISTSALERHL